jgi:hypothetical protein
MRERRQRTTREETARGADGGGGVHPLLDLQRAAGNRAAAGLLARRTEPGPTPGKVVLSGHSGADMPIAQMVGGEMSPSKLQALFLFDTMYPDAGFEKTIWRAVEQRLDQDLFALTAIDASTTGGRDAAEERMVRWVVENGFRVYNVHGGFYGKSSQYLVEQRDAWLARNRHVVGTKRSRIHQAILANIRITPGGGGHWNIISADDHLETAIGMLPAGA